MPLSKENLKVCRIALMQALEREQSLTAQVRISVTAWAVNNELYKLHIGRCRDFCCEDKPYAAKWWNVHRAPGQYISMPVNPMQHCTFRELHALIAETYGEL